MSRPQQGENGVDKPHLNKLINPQNVPSPGHGSQVLMGPIMVTRLEVVLKAHL
ncbi:MAG: hypothetical protein JRI39_15145 [Deltaproteobacteria bacterium]|nr:hypothetical protein [Deltaproteobacteria bacterium]